MENIISQLCSDDAWKKWVFNLARAVQKRFWIYVNITTNFIEK